MTIDKYELKEINRADLRSEFKIYQESKSLTNNQYIKELGIKHHQFLAYKHRGTACHEVIETIAGFFGRKAIHEDRVKPASTAISFGKKSSKSSAKTDPKACIYRREIEEHQSRNEEKDLARLYA